MLIVQQNCGKGYAYKNHFWENEISRIPDFIYIGHPEPKTEKICES